MRPQKKVRHAHRHELDGGDAFLSDSRHGFVPIDDGDVEAFGEEFIAAATSNDAIGEVARDETYAEEVEGFALTALDPEIVDRADVY